eukprot:1161532-Pelagomonas_calceolata.AAC.5
MAASCHILACTQHIIQHQRILHSIIYLHACGVSSTTRGIQHFVTCLHARGVPSSTRDFYVLSHVCMHVVYHPSPEINNILSHACTHTEISSSSRAVQHLVTCLHARGISSSTREMQLQAVAVAPVAMAVCDTSMRKKWVGIMGGRMQYSGVATNSTEPQHSSGRSSMSRLQTWVQPWMESNGSTAPENEPSKQQGCSAASGALLLNVPAANVGPATGEEQWINSHDTSRCIDPTTD